MQTPKDSRSNSKVAPVTVLGHPEQRRMLQKLLEANRLPSAMMFAGVSGIGKRLVADELAHSLFCERRELPSLGSCKSCKSCKLLAAGNFPDYHILDCMDREEFDIDRLRELLHTLSMRPFMGKERLIVLDNSEHLSVQSANLLLKSLEEPRAGNFFILICSNPAMLPPTLISRCQVWFFDRLNNQTVEQALKERGITERLADLVELADGSLQSLSSMQERLEDWQSICADLREIASGSFIAATNLSQDLAKNKEGLRENLALLRIAARRMMRESDDLEQSFRWSSMLLDLLSAERLILERNLGAAYVMNLILSRLAKQGAFTRSLRGATLIDRIAV
jgi:DNA polymerase-3 subunit delta'